ncbi:glycine betaine/proline transport system substrate-binding protein [Cytobacillus horneckiae]|uniref:Glycine/betaine ABC transporter n=1 Tax=Cytobacillus horneckiae TaxID=549687 RepID=A0A2N0ZBZ4_9BACI|nr:glycine betaine ABC transporter substrate-binding protein [Cytobacillus horneckiae]MBN6886045.1 glycine/betaine ABC transporter [Cytobacillus horneckiae]MCM3176350.1 glycine/betaine ABC transporter [Cytobacillus horneckiae]MEC1159172.1 glycine betaine ABC transporter substrate-binding protein [Cytobacillus horneckiae]MED2940753.1 glycine betaine ABC transporter substrate-binding protein [Cytobacillus horneckiae]PKG27026.1 glycine/betaine ABC transporter [Cytobacillus horneckiae]
MKRKIVAFILMLTLVGLSACGSSEEVSNNDKSLGENMDYKIIGIDPGAGIMKATEKAIADYELSEWKLIEGSSAAMTAELKRAYDKKEPIIVTGWSPHWKFSKYDLKYLEDPKGSFGEKENIHTITKVNLEAEHPSAFKLLEQFSWTEDSMNEVMMEIINGGEPEKVATEWINQNGELVSRWKEGIRKVDNDKLILGYVAWDTEIASTNVIAAVLSDIGYDVTLKQVEAGPMWAGIADGSLDAHVAGWLPLTHADYYEKFEGEFIDLGANLEGTKIGLVVPEYVEIDSIDDLK